MNSVLTGIPVVAIVGYFKCLAFRVCFDLVILIDHSGPDQDILESRHYLALSMVVVTTAFVVSTAVANRFFVTAGYIIAKVTTTPKINLPIALSLTKLLSQYQYYNTNRPKCQPISKDPSFTRVFYVLASAAELESGTGAGFSFRINVIDIALGSRDSLQCIHGYILRGINDAKQF
jgi:hypothetical protein